MALFQFCIRSAVLWLPIAAVLYQLMSEKTHAKHNGFCDNDNFNNRPTHHAVFTKELSSAEYGPVNAYKTLNCCAKKYESLEWFKDGKPYPWADGVSSFTINPDSSNQTIYTENLKKSDRGKYTCVLTDYTTTTSHSFRLSVISQGGYLKGSPLWTYKMSSISSPSGQSVRLYCEAFVGKANSDSSSTITWRKKGEPQAIQSDGKYVIEKVVRESDLVLGAFLYIHRMVDADYGEYECTATNTAKQTAVHSLMILKSVGHEQTLPYKLQDRIDSVFHTTWFFVWINSTLLLCVYVLLWIESISVNLQNLKVQLVKRLNIMLGCERTIAVMIFFSKCNRPEAVYMKAKLEQRYDYNFCVSVVDLSLDAIRHNHFLLAKDCDFAIYIMAWNDNESKESYHLSLRRYQKYGKCKVVACEMPNTPTIWCEELISNVYDQMEDNDQK